VIAFEALGLAYGASELGLALLRRSRRTRAQSHDKGTLGLVWIVVGLSIGTAFALARTSEFGRFEGGPWTGRIALAVFGLGCALRAWSVLVLGRFFTVDVAIHAGHELVARGPYRVLRHPSYTGALLIFFGLGLQLHSWPALLVLVLPLLGVFLRRIQVEERALAQHFGAAWTAHCERTWRLVPGLW
jgi:protein-S-isoprenylcysteine O-methyltransferase